MTVQLAPGQRQKPLYLGWPIAIKLAKRVDRLDEDLTGFGHGRSLPADGIRFKAAQAAVARRTADGAGSG